MVRADDVDVLARDALFAEFLNAHADLGQLPQLPRKAIVIRCGSRSARVTAARVMTGVPSACATPLPTSSAGAEMSCPNDTSFDSFCCTHVCTW